KGDSMEEKFAMDKFLECVLVYKSDVEKELFENYILDNWDKVNQSINENNKRVFGTEHLSQLEKEDITKKVKTVKVLKDELENFRT
ncbi:TPA: ATP-binding protein, partial [Staphylococcus aureus]|nr:ATP-binding protein [Staphylococcus aureus]